MATKKGPKTPMTNEHKEALARGRAEGKAVRDYLEALRANKPRRGRKRTPESINRRITAIDSEIMNADPLTELKLVEERRRLLEDLTTIGNKVDIEQLEKAFVSVAKSYGQRQGISYASWREVEVDARVLRAAGLGRSS
jgi:uncharacterized protein YicC (UPF0701 family)